VINITLEGTEMIQDTSLEIREMTEPIAETVAVDHTTEKEMIAK